MHQPTSVKRVTVHVLLFQQMENVVRLHQQMRCASEVPTVTVALSRAIAVEDPHFVHRRISVNQVMAHVHLFQQTGSAAPPPQTILCVLGVLMETAVP